MKQIVTDPLIIWLLKLLIPAYDFVLETSKHPKLLKERSFIFQIYYRYIPLTFFFTWLFSLAPTEIDSFLYLILMLLGSISIYAQANKADKYKSTLYYMIILYFGFLGIRAFVGHSFMADYVANYIGWQSGSPFQLELAFYHLGLALASLTYIWNQTKELALGLIISKSVFLFGAMGIHIYEVIVSSNFSQGNIGFGIIFGDLLLPLLMIYLYRMSYHQKRFS